MWLCYENEDILINFSTKCLETECDCQKYLLSYYKPKNSSEVLNKELELVK